MNKNEAIEYIHSVSWRGSKPGLERINALCALLGTPQDKLKFIHVAGTNGKGSFCSMLSSVLTAAGYRTGLYTSPYIKEFGERMRVGGENIPKDTLAEITSYVRPIADAMKDKPTEFELITAIAFLYFKRHNCDIVVLEVGMGGRLDSTNVIPAPLVSVITGVALDHTVVLGTTVAQIAAEKAGIIKNGSVVVYGGRDDVAFGVVAEKANSLECDLVRTDLSSLNVIKADIEGSVFDYKERKSLKLSLCGTYQPENAATVIETVNTLNKLGFAVSENALAEGLSSARWRARFELLANNPPVVFDGSHNIQGVTAAANSIARLFEGKVAMLMGVLADKDYNDMASILAPLACKIFAITPPSPRALSSNELAKTFSSLGVESKPFSDILAAVEEAYAYAKAQNVPLVMLGSLYMYGEVYNCFKKVINN